MAHTTGRPDVTSVDRRALAETLGVPYGEEGPETWAELAADVDAAADTAFARMGESIRDDLSGRLDEALLAREREAIVAQVETLPAVREAGVPDEPGELYGAVAEPGWRLYDHLVDVGFFASLDANLPRFTADHVEATSRELLLAEPLGSDLGRIGFDEHEKTALLSTVATNADRLARWVPSNQIPDEVEFDTSNVPPLHRRATGGSLLWIRGLDRHLWQNRVLVTDGILDDAAGWVKTMLGGLYVLATAAEDVAASVADRRLTDAQLTAAFTAAAAVQIVAQEELMRDVFYVTDELRAPSELR